MAPVITLTTDFGLRDTYVAEMKGVILDILGATALLVDVTHDIEAHDLTEGALALEAAAPHFPLGTIHLAVVIPSLPSTPATSIWASSATATVASHLKACSAAGSRRSSTACAPRSRITKRQATSGAITTVNRPVLGSRP